MNPTYDFKGQVALVTGASSGMGLATAQAFAKAGAAVVLADVNEAALRTAADDLTAAGHQALGVTCDVSDEDQVAALVERAVATFGRLDMAFNNAGIQVPPSDAADEPADIFDRVNAINLRGVWARMKHELRQMRTQGSGAIVNCSSLGGLVGLPGRRRLPRVQTRRDRAHQERRAAIRAARHPHQCDLSGDDRDADGHRDDREGGTRLGGSGGGSTDRPAWAGGGDRGSRALVLQPGRRLRGRGRAPRGRRLYRPVSPDIPLDTGFPRTVDEHDAFADIGSTIPRRKVGRYLQPGRHRAAGDGRTPCRDKTDEGFPQ